MYYRRVGFPHDDIEAYKWLALAESKLPEGNAKRDCLKMLSRLKKRMIKEQIDEANKKVLSWYPLKQASAVMRDEDD